MVLTKWNYGRDVTTWLSTQPQKAAISHRSQVQEFLLRFDLGPPEGFQDLEEEIAVPVGQGVSGQSVAEVTPGTVLLFWCHGP